MWNLVPFQLLIGYPRTKTCQIKFPMEKNFGRLPQRKHPSMCFLIPFPSSICSREKKIQIKFPRQRGIGFMFLQKLGSYVLQTTFKEVIML